ncbi:septum formation initiator family protein [Candidatus Roizmanbacteria bacterium]|nr:septum formation initiator family protein [Candidatus Roizmanbacteria bacterium]
MVVIKKLFFALLIIFLFSSLIPNVFNYQNKLSFYRQTKQELDEEKKRSIELKTEIVKKKSSDEVEKTIRNKLNLLKENEVALIIPSPTPRPIRITPTPAPIYIQWREVFFK